MEVARWRWRSYGGGGGCSEEVMEVAMKVVEVVMKVVEAVLYMLEEANGVRCVLGSCSACCSVFWRRWRASSIC